MSCPYFEIQKSEDYENIASIIIADKETKHFLRHRRYARLCESDEGVTSAFDKKIRHSQSGYFMGLRFFSIIFPIMIAVSVLSLIYALPEERLALIAIPITALLIGVVWAIFLSCHIIEFAFVKSYDRLFIAYDGDGNPYSVEISKKRIRVLHRDTLYVIKGKKIKKIRKEKQLYYAYLNMFPQSVLNMEKYVDNSDKSAKPVIIPSITNFNDGRCTLSFGKIEYSSPQNLSAGFDNFCPKSLLRHLHFYKYIFTVNNNLQLISVYSAARENAVITYDVVTFAQLTESGNAATKALKELAATNNLLKNVLNKIENSI